MGATGTIIATTNGGGTWTKQTSGTTQTVLAISCFSATQCWAVGGAGAILATTTGGGTWTAQTSPTTQDLEAISCVSATQCWAVGNGGVIVTTANGTTWTAQTSPTTQAFGIHCVSTTQCWAAGGNGVIVATTNGSTWTTQTVGTNTFYAVTCASATACWAAGANGVIYATTNGTTWTAQTSGTTEDIWGLDCISAAQCWANGSTTAGSAGVVLVTTNGGATWFPPACAQYLQWTFAPVVASGAPVTSAVLTLVDDASATPSAGTATYVLVSANGGSNWTPFSIGNPTTTLATQTLSISLGDRQWDGRVGHGDSLPGDRQQCLQEHLRPGPRRHQLSATERGPEPQAAGPSRGPPAPGGGARRGARE